MKKLLFLNIDSEFQNEEFLTLQILGKTDEGVKLFVYYNSEFTELFEKRKENYWLSFQNSFPNTPLPVFVSWDYKKENMKLEEMIFYDFLKRCGIVDENSEDRVLKFLKFLIQISFFYSLRDLYYLFSDVFISQFFSKGFGKNNFLTKKNSHFGKWNLEVKKCKISVLLHDFYGLCTSGFDNLLKTLGVKNSFKSSPLNKCCMKTELLEKFDVFLNYAIADVISLSQCEEKLIQNVNSIAKDVLKIKSPSYIPGVKPSPVTCGRLVNDMFLSFVNSYIDNYEEKKLLKRFQKINELLEVNSSNVLKKKKTSKSITFSNLISGSSVQSFLYSAPNTTISFNAFVHGGRCLNESPTEYFGDQIADLDFSGCYGAALKEFLFPLGLPTVFGSSKDNSHVSLKNFLNKFESELVPNLFQIVVSGKLSFRQSLIYSKIIEEKNLRNKIRTIEAQMENEENDLEEVSNGDFCILHYEIENGIITSDMLETLKKVCSDSEYGEILNLNVVTASFYKKSDRRSLPQMIEEIEKCPGEYKFNSTTSSVIDTRSRLWTEIPLNSFVNPLIKERQKLKKDLKEQIDSETKESLQARERFLQLMINTLYGLLCSPYFPVNNTIVAKFGKSFKKIIWKFRKYLKYFQ